MKKELILAGDIGTSSAKAAIFDMGMNLIAESKHPHSYTVVGSLVDMDGEMLFNSFLSALEPLGEFLDNVVAVGFSVLCPGLFCLDENGLPLRPGIIHLDRRSEKQGLELVKKVGEEKFRSIAGNLPYPGGISVTAIQWIKETEPAIYNKTYKFGHTNTLFIKKLTGQWGIDPTNASFTGLYDTVGFTDWSNELCDLIGVPKEKLPPVIPSAKVAGNLNKEASKLTGLKEGIPVIMGAADTACAVFGAGAVNDGQLLNSTGTVEVMAISLEKPYYNENFVLRTHVIPNRWILMNIIGAGGESLNWVHKEFFRDLSDEQFFNETLPKLYNDYDSGGVTFIPHLAGDRTSIKNKTGILSGLTLATKRENILYAVVEGIIKQMEDGMEIFRKISKVSNTIFYAGGGSNTLKYFKEKTFNEFNFEIIDNAALKGIYKLITMAVR